MPEARVGVIGGSGLYRMSDLTDVETVELDTPWGPPSDAITIGTLSGVRVAFIPRHGRYHQLSPSRVPARANFWALKTLGVRQVISVSAVGSMRDDVHPLDLVVPDQVFDQTNGRALTFFDRGPVVHVSMAEPFCPATRAALLAAGAAVTQNVHDGGTYLCIEGPQFSTKAASRIYRSWDVDVIGMTAMPEARLAREAEMCFAVLALVTDYDVWHETEAAVSVSTVIDNLHRNVDTAREILKAAVQPKSESVACECGHALEHAIVTAPEAIPLEIRERLGLLIGRYLP